MPAPTLTMYPPGPVTFEESYVDDILGTVHKRSQVVRDRDQRLRRRDDIGQPDRDHLLEGWIVRAEEPVQPI